MSMEMIGNREKKTYSGWILGMEAHQSFIRQHANVTDVLSQDGRIESTSRRVPMIKYGSVCDKICIYSR